MNTIEIQNSEQYKELEEYAKKEDNQFILNLIEDKSITYVKLTETLGSGILASIDQKYKSILSLLIGEKLVSLFRIHINGAIGSIEDETNFDLIHARNTLDIIKKYFPHANVNSLEERYSTIESGTKNMKMISEDAYTNISSVFLESVKTSSY